MLNATQLVGFGGKAKTGAYYSASYLGKLADDRYVSISGSDVFVLDASFNLVFKKTLTGCTVSHYDGESILHGWRAGSASEKFVFSKLTIGASDITVDAQYEVTISGTVNSTTQRSIIVRSPNYVFFMASSYATDTEDARHIVRCPISDMATRETKVHTGLAANNAPRYISVCGDDLIIAGWTSSDYTNRTMTLARYSDGLKSSYYKSDGVNYLFPSAYAAWYDASGANLYYCGQMLHVPTGHYVARLATDHITHSWARQLPAQCLNIWEDPDNTAYLYAATTSKLFKIAKSDGAVVQGYDAARAHTGMVKKSARPYVLSHSAGNVFVSAIQHSFRNGNFSSYLSPNADTLASISAPPNLTTATSAWPAISGVSYAASSLTTVDACSAIQPTIYRV